MELKVNHKPVRVAMDQAYEAIQAIKPVFLMSPLSVAMYLPGAGPRFEVVIFDEASQVKPEDALGGLLRADQSIVVGDSKQLPPTSFFDKLTSEDGLEDEDEVDEGAKVAKDMESVLALMSAKVPANSPRRRDLRWHYRSLHDDLIAVSNRLFYDDRLVVFPSPRRAGSGAGLGIRYDPNTIYGRGGKRTNPIEARQVAAAALKHVQERPGLTIGIAAFSKAQQEAIQDEIDILRREHPDFGEFDSRHPFEPTFVKNLENVQGDERDVILISVGYGRDEGGYVSMNFGPLNRDGGERRLNVLITRARVRCEVFTNLRSTDLRLGESPGRGVAALKHFLTFIETGSMDMPFASGREPMSPFEEEVLDRLWAAGFDVEPQVGSCGFFIDMAVRHPEDSGRFVLGIECDGAMYHRARSARDRDRLRQEVLESRGWKLHRIWSTDWFHNSEREFERLAAAIQHATSAAQPDEPLRRPSESANTALEELIDPTEETQEQETVSPPYVLSGAKSPVPWKELHDIMPREMAGWIEAIVGDEAPVHVEEVLRRMREAQAVGRAGSRIRESFAAGVRASISIGLCEMRGNFLYRPGQTGFPVRSRAGFPGNYKSLDYVADEEICTAIRDQVARAYRITRSDVPKPVGTMLGFDRVTTDMAARIVDCLDAMVRGGELDCDNGWVTARAGQEQPGVTWE